MSTILGSGAGSRLPTPVLVLSGVSTLVAVVVSATSIYLHLKNYRKSILQRMVIRIMVMVPIYAVSSLIALFSLEAAFVIDAVRDLYEAFVIYCFFVLLLSYLGGERSLLILLHGRSPKTPVFPANLFSREIDVSDPHTFLFLKRGILQYVQVKPVLALVTFILKAFGKFNEGDFRANSGYLYVSIIYNASICLSLYCLAVFWLCVNDDLKPFRPVPKFLCVKGILFFSFWQSIGISVLVAARVIKKLGPYTDAEHISLGLTDTLICLEMPIFAFAHMYAFAHTDYIDRRLSYAARMPMYYAFRDAFGLLDVIEDSKITLRGEGMDYREFEPAEGVMHQGVGRERRIRAGLRYTKGGQRKYWLPQHSETQAPGHFRQGVNRAISRIAGRNQVEDDVRAPLFEAEAEGVLHLAPDLQSSDEDPDIWDRNARINMWDEEERVLRDERGAWFSPIRGAKGLAALQGRDRPVWHGYGAVGSMDPGVRRGYHDTGNGLDQPTLVAANWTKIRGGDPQSRSSTPRSQSPYHHSHPVSHAGPSSLQSSVGSHNTSRMRSPPMNPSSRITSRIGPSSPPMLPPDAVDLIVEDHDASQDKHTRERRKGEPAVRGSGMRKVYKRGFVSNTGDSQRADGEIEPREPHGEDRVEAGEDLLDGVGAEQINDSGRDSDGSQAPEGLIVRAATPPIHARVLIHEYDDDNPWA
ncbi:Transmembrane protein 184 like protein [Termitomyces sp. J132]|nr:Transmembrane protein 184 like protein [Termitomyces sp. J132]